MLELDYGKSRSVGDGILRPIELLQISIMNVAYISDNKLLDQKCSLRKGSNGC